MKKQDFLDDVSHEIEMLKKHATKKEKSNLNFDKLNYDDAGECIYGQLTGSCGSKRAKELMDKACIRVMDLENEGGGHINIGVGTFRDIRGVFNGKNEGQVWTDEGQDNDAGANVARESRIYTHLSALEGYIVFKGAKNKHIILYLRGEVKTLKL